MTPELMAIYAEIEAIRARIAGFQVEGTYAPQAFYQCELELQELAMRARQLSQQTGD